MKKKRKRRISFKPRTYIPVNPTCDITWDDKAKFKGWVSVKEFPAQFFKFIGREEFHWAIREAMRTINVEVQNPEFMADELDMRGLL